MELNFIQSRISNHVFILKLAIVFAVLSGCILYTLPAAGQNDNNVGTLNSFVQNLQSGEDLISIPIGNNEFINLTDINTHATRARSVIRGKVENSNPSFGYFIVEGDSVGGSIIIKEENKAYTYSTNSANNVIVEEIEANDVICNDYPIASSDNTRKSRIQAPPPGSPVYQLESLPGATAVIMLDFDGHDASRTVWGNIIAAPADVSENEITEAWNMISEDYRPFQVNVTTNEAVYQAAPDNRRTRAIFTPTNFYGSGGVAFIGTFNFSGDLFPCFVFNLFGKPMGETGSHEVGHVMRLLHDGRNFPDGSHEEYYFGNGTFAPIMGAAFDPVVGHWSIGEYQFANNHEDDVNIIGTTNGFDFRPDSEGSSIANAMPLTIQSNGTVLGASNQGIIITRNDIDFFSFTTTGGNVQLTINPAAIHPNLDPIVSIINQQGTTIQTQNPPLIAPCIFNLNLEAGTYYIRIDGTGFGDPFTNGYSDYSSIGLYTISGTIPVGVTPPETSFVLVNAASDTDISNITEGQVIFKQEDESINIRFNPGTANVESVRFLLNGKVFRIENVAPYALAGDINGDYQEWAGAVPGTYELTAIPYTGNNATGTAGPSSTIHFSIQEATGLRVVGFTLINADTDQDIRPLNNGDIIYRGQLPTLHLNVRADVNNTSQAGNLEFRMDNTFLRNERTMPYALFGDLNGNYELGNIIVGKHTLTATPFTKEGEEGQSLTIQFEVREGNPAKIMNSVSIDLFVADTETDVLIYPNPSRSIFNFKISNIQTSDNELCIYNSMGLCISKFKGTEYDEVDYFTWNAEGMQEGIYYYQYRSGKFYKTGTLKLIK